MCGRTYPFCCLSFLRVTFKTAGSAMNSCVTALEHLTTKKQNKQQQQQQQTK